MDNTATTHKGSHMSPAHTAQADGAKSECHAKLDHYVSSKLDADGDLDTYGGAPSDNDADNPRSAP